jgi:hypothetical protein
MATVQTSEVGATLVPLKVGSCNFMGQYIFKVAQSVQRLSYGLDDQGSIPSRDNDGTFFWHCFPTSSWVQPASYLMGMRGS